MLYASRLGGVQNALRISLRFPPWVIPTYGGGLLGLGVRFPWCCGALGAVDPHPDLQGLFLHCTALYLTHERVVFSCVTFLQLGLQSLFSRTWRV